MGRRTKQINVDDFQARRFGSVARLLQDCYSTWRDRVLVKLVKRGHDRVGMSHSVVLRNMDIDGTPLSVITKRAGVSRQAVAKVASQLVVMGYVKTAPDPGDRRAKMLKLTPKGLTLFTDSMEIYDEVERGLVERIGRRRLEEFRSTLKEISQPVPASRRRGR